MIDENEPILEDEPRGMGRFGHIVTYVNLAFVLGLSFEAGVQYNRMSQLEARVTEVQHEAISTAELSGQISMLREEMKRVRDRLDRFLDEGK